MLRKNWHDSGNAGGEKEFAALDFEETKDGFDELSFCHEVMNN